MSGESVALQVDADALGTILVWAFAHTISKGDAMTVTPAQIDCLRLDRNPPLVRRNIELRYTYLHVRLEAL